MSGTSGSLPRRKFLVAASGLSAGAALAACGVGAVPEEELEVQKEVAASQRSGGGPSAELVGGPEAFTTPTEMVRPVGIGQNDERKFIYVAASDGKIFNFTLDGKLEWWSGGEGSEPGQYSNPVDITQDRARNLWVLDEGNSRVQKFNFYLGRPEGHLPTAETWGDAEIFDNPIGIRASGFGLPFIIDKGGERLRRFNSLGDNPLLLDGEPGGVWTSVTAIPIEGFLFALLWIPETETSKMYQFNRSESKLDFVADFEGLKEPGRFSVDRNDQYFVVVPSTNEIHRYGIDGQFHMKWGGMGSADGEFDGATGIQAGVEGVYVADTNNNRVQRFDADGNFLGAWGGEGTGGAA